MKKWIKWTLIGIVVLLVIAVVAGFVFIIKGQKIKSFDVSKFEELIEKFPYDAQFARIEDRSDAVKIADSVIEERFPKVKRYEFYPYQVYFDSVNDCWLVEGRAPLSNNIIRATPYVIIDGDGSVLAACMW